MKTSPISLRQNCDESSSSTFLRVRLRKEEKLREQELRLKEKEERLKEQEERLKEQEAKDGLQTNR